LPKFYQISPIFPIQNIANLGYSIKFALKTSLAVNSIECCQCKYNECNIGQGLSGGGGHGVMIPPVQQSIP
jgi:hypothetical protein